MRPAHSRQRAGRVARGAGGPPAVSTSRAARDDLDGSAAGKVAVTSAEESADVDAGLGRTLGPIGISLSKGQALRVPGVDSPQATRNFCGLHCIPIRGRIGHGARDHLGEAASRLPSRKDTNESRPGTCPGRLPHRRSTSRGARANRRARSRSSRTGSRDRVTWSRSPDQISPE
jgi:hypothetical protein